MLTKTEFEEDLENLKQLQEDGKIAEGVTVKSICHITPDVSQDVSQNVIQLKAWKQHYF